MGLLANKSAKKDPWESIFSEYGVKNPYAIQRKTVVKQLPTEYPIVTIGGEKKVFGKKITEPKQTGFYDSNADFIPLSKEQLANLGDKKTFTTYQPTEQEVFIDTTTGKEIKTPKQVISFGPGGQGYQLKKEGDISYRVKFDESGNPSFYAKQLEDDSFGSFITEGLTAISPVLLAGFPIGSVLGSALAPTLSAATQAVIGNALVQGTLAEMQGGEFLKGAAGGAIGAGVGNFVTPGISEALGGGQFGNVAAGALTGGGVSALMGGDFVSGALKGGISAGLNEYQQQLRQEQFDTAMTESGLAGQTLMDSGEQTVLEPWQQSEGISQLLNELSPYQQPYVLGANEVFAEPDIQPLPVDNSGKLTATNVLKTLAPIALTALLAKNVQEPSSAETSSGYPIVPIPGDWKPPTYNQAFTPSAPIDFGTFALLAGTQWENPQTFQSPQEYNLSNLINTLNYQSVPFVPKQYDMPQQVSAADFINQFQTPTVGTGEFIGNLGGKPVSIADIISGIQSQYG